MWACLLCSHIRNISYNDKINSKLTEYKIGKRGYGMNKKWFLFGIMLIGLTLFSGCGKQKIENNTETLIYDDSVLDNKNNIVIGISQVGSESDWRNANTQSYKDIFTEDKGYYVIFEDAQQKQENQVKSIRNFILQEVDYIVLDPIVETGWDSVLQEAKDAGIPVILVDRKVKVESDSLYTCWVGSDFIKEGKGAGIWLINYLKKIKKSDQNINIVTLQGTLGSTAQIGRTEGFNQVLRSQRNWTMLDRQSGEFTQAKGEEIMEYFLKSYDDIDVVVSENDNMTFGAIDAIKQAGKRCGEDIIVISFDAVYAALEAIEHGDIQVDFECNPLLGPYVEEIIQSLEQGKEVQKIQYVDETYFDYTMNISERKKDRVY